MAWDPEAYRQFNDQRSRPFMDLLDLLPPLQGVRLLDFGCGDGRLTRLAAERFSAAEVMGIDSSEAMISAAQAGPGGSWLETWRHADINDVLDEADTADLVISNAALQFVPDHASVIPRMLARVAPGGWIAIHMPYNHIARSHLLMEMAARTDELAGALRGFQVTWPQERPETYTRLLKESRFEHGLVQLRTYRHPLQGANAIVDWMKTGGLQPWLDELDPSRHGEFLDVYGRMLALAYPPLPGDLRLLDYTRLLLVAWRPG